MSLVDFVSLEEEAQEKLKVDLSWALVWSR
jgi:hypothetical protein